MNEIESKELEIYLSKGFVKEDWVKTHLTNLYNRIKSMETGITFSEKVYLHLYGVKPMCKICGGECKFLSIKRGYRKYCSKKCSNSDIELIEKKNINYKKNSIEKWGVDNPMKNKIVVDKLKLSLIGQDIIEKNRKIKSVFLEKWGVDNPSKLDWVKEKKKMTNEKKLGVDNPFKHSEIKKGISEKNKNQVEEISKKRKLTLLQKFGVDNPMKDENVRAKKAATCILKYGVPHVKQSQIVKDRMKDILIKKLNSELSGVMVLDVMDVFKLKCLECDGIFEMYKSTFYTRKRFTTNICSHCNPIKSNSSFLESNLYDFIISKYPGKILRNHRIGNFEIDIFLEELSIGFEFNGVYWHSSKFKDKDSHRKKFDFFKNRGIQIIQIWEDDWIYKRPIIESMIEYRLFICNKKIWARKCNVRILKDNKIVRDFLETNHIQGFVGSKIKLGLYLGDELVSIMTFGELRKSLGSVGGEGEWELIRFCNKLGFSVVGGASKLFKFFINTYSPKRILSYSKNDHSFGEIYKKLNFKFSGETVQNYYYVIDGRRYGRFNFRKDKLIKQGYDEKLTETQIMESRGYYRIWDTGNIKWVWNS